MTKESNPPRQTLLLYTITSQEDAIMSNTIYLYLKTHNKTGLKYLGKTARNPHTYKGSGKHWLRHIEKHGYDITTEILFETTDVEEFKRVAFETSKKLNVVESEEFANLVHEVGDGGANNVGREFSDSWKENLSKSVSDTKNSLEWKETSGKHAAEKTRKTKREPTWIEEVGKPSWEIGGKKQSETKLDKNWIKNHQVVCEHCSKSVSTANYKRWHGNNCFMIKKREIVPYSGNVCCPHCGVEGHKSPAMSRWHFDNCKKR